MKEMQYRPKIEEHDYQFKKKHVQTFLEQGNKVKCFVLFRGREKAHTEFGREILDRLAEDLKEIASIENKPKMEGHSMNMLLAPLPGAIKKPLPQTGKKGRKSERGAADAEPDEVDDLGDETVEDSTDESFEDEEVEDSVEDTIERD